MTASHAAPVRTLCVRIVPGARSSASRTARALEPSVGLPPYRQSRVPCHLHDAAGPCGKAGGDAVARDEKGGEYN
jgi:hypothetical protein